MTHEYEILFIMKPHLGEEIYTETITTFQSWITSTGGEIVSLKPLGTRELATIFNKFSQGYYVQCHFKGNNATLDEIQNRVRVSEIIFRQLVVTIDSIIEKPRPEKEKKAKKTIAAKPPESSERPTEKVGVKG